MLCISFLTTLSPAEYTMTMSLSHSPQFQCSFSSFIAKFSTSGKADVLLAIDNGMFIIVLMQLIYIYHEYSRLPDYSQFFYLYMQNSLNIVVNLYFICRYYRYYKCDYLDNVTKKFMEDLSLHMRVKIIAAEETSLINYYSIN